VVDYLSNASQGILADKDLQILELRQQAMHLRDDLNVANMDADRKSVSVLTKVRSLMCIGLLYLFLAYQCSQTDELYISH
jgi:hypothetical protein